MIHYNWEHTNWPNFTYSLENVEEALLLFTQKAGVLTGILQSLPKDAHQETVIQLMLQEALKTSEIEGEFFSREDVLSSIQRNLGLDENPVKGDKKAIGIGKLMTMVREDYHKPLSHSELFAWHTTLLPDEHPKITTGAYRTDESPMQVISGALGKQKVHFEAPPSKRVPDEMQNFVDWFNTSEKTGVVGTRMAPVRAAIAHLYFESIHPFDDGNGRIGRAVADKALSQGVGRPIVMSLSDMIQTNKKEYYTQLERAQQTLEITEWIIWFVDMVLKSLQRAEDQIEFTLRKVKFFDRFDEQLNERQRKVLLRMLEDGPDGFEGGMNARKYKGITKTSKATATRDMQMLLEIGAFVHDGNAGGRSTKYRVNI